MNLKDFKKAYFIGIKGVGMTALAQIFQAQGLNITGSDTEEKFMTDEVLKRLGLKYFEIYDKNHITIDIDLIVVTTSQLENNVELERARELGLKILTYPEALALVFNDKFGIAICGTHGKTTTTALAGQILEGAGLEPTVLVGSKVLAWQSNARGGKSKYFVAEIDEYQNKFKYFTPQIIVLTSVEWDHPDYFKKFKDYRRAFADFIKRLPATGLLIANFDDKNVRTIIKETPCRIISYGKSIQADYYFERLKFAKNKQQFRVYLNKKKLAEFSLPLLGEFNILNALAALVLANHLSVRLLDIQKISANFQGTARRLEKKGSYREAIIFDDYAHHPTEIQVTLETLRQFYSDKKIWCIFQPHTFSRTKVLLRDFARSFSQADKIIVLDIYGSAREKAGIIHSRDLVREAKKYHREVIYISTIEQVVDYLAPKLAQGDLVVTMGAGDVWKVGERLLAKK
jgi:UDP-N-acetylmuramate--alanine ligase